MYIFPNDINISSISKKVRRSNLPVFRPPSPLYTLIIGKMLNFIVSIRFWLDPPPPLSVRTTFWMVPNTGN